mmetsp:Transcript_28808/g.54399  ORF Transcript_28808/g.54399 Transcript_28808/m.54399 type:complete len:213 (+) Transcript_28808:1436-2074(+)
MEGSSKLTVPTTPWGRSQLSPPRWTPVDSCLYPPRTRSLRGPSNSRPVTRTVWKVRRRPSPSPLRFPRTSPFLREAKLSWAPGSLRSTSALKLSTLIPPFTPSSSTKFRFLDPCTTKMTTLPPPSPLTTRSPRLPPFLNLLLRFSRPRPTGPPTSLTGTPLRPSGRATLILRSTEIPSWDTALTPAMVPPLMSVATPFTRETSTTSTLTVPS